MRNGVNLSCSALEEWCPLFITRFLLPLLPLVGGTHLIGLITNKEERFKLEAGHGSKRLGLVEFPGGNEEVHI